jgi:hypothetical protein
MDAKQSVYKLLRLLTIFESGNGMSVAYMIYVSKDDLDLPIYESEGTVETRVSLLHLRFQSSAFDCAADAQADRQAQLT